MGLAWVQGQWWPRAGVDLGPESIMTGLETGSVRAGLVQGSQGMVEPGFAGFGLVLGWAWRLVLLGPACSLVPRKLTWSQGPLGRPDVEAADLVLGSTGRA